MKVRTQEVDRLVLDGAELLYNAVRTTLGPRGRNVLINYSNGSFTVTHDGVTVAEAVNPLNEKKYGAKLIRDAASKMKDDVGDGTTTTTILAYHILKGVSGMRNPMKVSDELQSIGSRLVSEIATHQVHITKKRLLQVATISSRSDEYGRIVKDVVSQVGKNGIVELELASDTSYEIKNGAVIGSGYANQYFVNNSQGTEARLEHPKVLVVQEKINSITEIINTLNQMGERGEMKLYIFAHDVSLQTMAALVMNREKSNFETVVVELPEYATVTLDDIAALTGAQVVGGAGVPLRSLDYTHLGDCERISSTSTETLIVSNRDMTNYIGSIKGSWKSDKRIAALTGNIAVIKVGGVSEADRKERRDRIEDAVCATKAALGGGVVPGGGITLLNVSSTIGRTKVERIVKHALQQVHIEILRNAGLRKRRSYDKGRGIDVMTNKEVNMLERGIIDPLKVTQEAVTIALSVVSVAITAGAVIDMEEV